MRWPVAVLLLSFCASAADRRAADLAGKLRDVALDPGECYKVRDLSFSKEDARIYLTDGYLIFAKAIDGRRIAAVFTADTEFGDAELLLMPPHRGERMALAAFTNAPNLNEHFRSAVMVFTDDTGKELLESAGNKKSAEMGAMLSEKWTPVIRNFVTSFEVRLVENLLSSRRPEDGFFYSALGGKTLGNFDIIHDPRAHNQITVGQVANRDGRSYFDTWTSFESRSFRQGRRNRGGPDFSVGAVTIDALLDPDLKLHGDTALTITPTTRIDGAVSLEISRDMTVLEAKVDGEPAEVFVRDSMRSNLIRGQNNVTFLVVPPRPLEAGKSYRVEVRHEGAVVSEAGDGVYFVGSRTSWHPNREVQFALYDVTFRYPKTLDLVATGEVVENRTDGDLRVTRRKTQVPIRFAGFNLGQYTHSSATQGGYTVEVYANKRLEDSFQQRQQKPILTIPSGPPAWGSKQRTPPVVIPEVGADQTAAPRTAQLASQIASCMDFMASRFGPAPFKKLTVSPIPGSFGQGFPGLIYLSTLSYMDPAQRRLQVESEELFFSDILAAHEVAHQWWGNVVGTADPEDDWLMEALASYSALLYLEKHKGPKVMETVLEQFKQRLLAKDKDGKTVESAGPITWSLRLISSLTPRAWRTITYEKGAWIIHMLRRRMGDDRFFPMLAELSKRYRFKVVTTGEFRQLAAEFMPSGAPDRKLEAFFEQWVYATGIPTLKMSYSLKGKAPALVLTGTLKQSDVPDDFSTLVPVEVQLGRGKAVTEWVATDNDPVSFTIKLKQMPLKVVLDPGAAVLARK